MKLTTKNRAQSITVFIVATFVYFTLLLSCNLGPFSAKPVPGLATRAAYHVGSAVGMTWLIYDSLMIKILRDDFNSITPENCMKPALIHPAQDIYYWKDGLLLAEFCKKKQFPISWSYLNMAQPGARLDEEF